MKEVFDEIARVESKAKKRRTFPLRQDMDSAVPGWRYFGVIISPEAAQSSTNSSQMARWRRKTQVTLVFANHSALK
jgi:hypothetical protein